MTRYIYSWSARSAIHIATLQHPRNIARVPFPQSHSSYKSFYRTPSSPTRNLTSSPGLKAGRPIYGHPSHRKASPNAQFPQLPTLPCTVKSTSASSRSAAENLGRVDVVVCEVVLLLLMPFVPLRILRSLSALLRRDASSASRR